MPTESLRIAREYDIFIVKEWIDHYLSRQPYNRDILYLVEEFQLPATREMCLKYLKDTKRHTDLNIDATKLKAETVLEIALPRFEIVHKLFPRCSNCCNISQQCKANCNQRTVNNISFDDYRLLQNLIDLIRKKLPTM